MKPSVVYQSRDVLVLTPDSLLIDPCEATAAGDTVRTLAKGYVANTNCIGQYKSLLKKQREHKSKVEALYNGR